MPHPARLPIEQLLRNCQVTRTRRSGPGGQHRNKVETAIVIEHEPTGVKAEASERRSQEANREQAVHRLRIKLALEIREPVSAESPVSELWQSRCRGGRLPINKDHQDFPAILSECLDRLAIHRWEVPPTAEDLALTNSQLIKLCKLEPHALKLINEQRHLLQRPPLK